MLLIVCVSAFVPLVCVMVVGEGCCGLCCFQWRVAVVSVSRRVPGVVLGFGVWVACLGVAGLVCVVWFRMLMCVCASFRVFVLLSWFCLFVWLITLPGRVGLVWCVLVGGVVWLCWWFGGACGVCCWGWRVLCGVRFWVCVVIGLLSLLLVKVRVLGL